MNPQLFAAYLERVSNKITNAFFEPLSFPFGTRSSQITDLLLVLLASPIHKAPPYLEGLSSLQGKLPCRISLLKC
ncbi:hypothetical protein [Shewanella sp. AS1]|uniref:hypothetical protein n=1 Tax=Shewanella sp. AS1 TaxID=2907626 RepID=UPI001F19AB83|nr:hypothetical protein [Shewanella sp. AS1]